MSHGEPISVGRISGASAANEPTRYRAARSSAGIGGVALAFLFAESGEESDDPDIFPVDPRAAQLDHLIAVAAGQLVHLVGERARVGQPGDRSVESLQSRVSRLRRRLEPGQPAEAAFDVLVTVRDGYQLTVSESQHDLLVLRRLVARARRARDAQSTCRNS